MVQWTAPLLTPPTQGLFSQDSESLFKAINKQGTSCLHICLQTCFRFCLWATVIYLKKKSQLKNIMIPFLSYKNELWVFLLNGESLEVFDGRKLLCFLMRLSTKYLCFSATRKNSKKHLTLVTQLQQPKGHQTCRTHKLVVLCFHLRLHSWPILRQLPSLSNGP